MDPTRRRIVAFVKMLQLRPESRLELRLRRRRPTGKDGDEGAQRRRISACRPANEGGEIARKRTAGAAEPSEP